MSILEKIAHSNKMPVLFIGAGLSRRYIYKYPDWETLLRTSFYKINPDPYFYQQYVDSLKREGLTQFEMNKKLGTIAENEFNKAFYERKIKVKTENPSWVKEGISPYKMYLALNLKKKKIYRTSWCLNEIEELKKLKNKIAAIITTNYDQFLEQEVFNEDYEVYKRQYEMFSSDSYNIAEIYKIHGCVSDAETIIVTEKDYENFEDSRKLFIAKMLTLFAESPIIFLGYSFTDENVQMIIKDFLNCLSKKDLENIHEHMIFVSWKKGEKNLIEVRNNIITKDGFPIPITEIQTDNYLKIYEILNNVEPGVSATRIRETKRIVKRIVDASINYGQDLDLIVGIDNLDNISTHKNLAIAVGYKDELKEYGYKGLPEIVIFEDILFNNKNLKPKSVCIDTYKSISHQRILPIFKYAYHIIDEVNSNSRLNTYIESKNAKEKIFSRALQKRLKNYPSVATYEEIIDRLSSFETLSKKCNFIIKNIDILSIEKLRDICISFFDDFKINDNCTEYKKCVVYLDFLENYPKYKEKSSISNFSDNQEKN